MTTLPGSERPARAALRERKQALWPQTAHPSGCFGPIVHALPLTFASSSTNKHESLRNPGFSPAFWWGQWGQHPEVPGQQPGKPGQWGHAQ